LNTAAFDREMCGYGLVGVCLPQPGIAQNLESLTAWLMYRLQYRNFGTHQSLVVNHTVDVNGTNRAGIRWYEIRKTTGNWSIYQQDTYSPDANHRWMGSVAMDNSGNMALGYSITNGSDIFPSIRYTGRLATDPLGQMPQGEGTIIAGTGSQISASGRWGDYSSMNVDPTDHCTFWYTTEYGRTDGRWNTQIASFEFPDQTPPLISNVPTPILVEQTSRDGTPVTVPLPTATDTCDATPVVTSNAPGVFPLGTTTVTFTATDSSGNTATATTSVTVVDTTAPVISNVPGPIRVEQTSRDGTPVTVPLPTATDICDAAPTVVSNAPAVFPLGTTTVTFTATDASGNTATATTSVTVVDTTAPVISNVPAPIRVEQTSRDGTPVTVPLPTATDICDAAPTVVSNAPAVFPLGTTTVTFTATDASGNKATATTRVTVVDTTDPVIASLTASPNVLWPPNHRLVPVTLAVSVRDICDLAPHCRIVRVTSNEPVNGTGDADTEEDDNEDEVPDWVITGDLTLLLRAERAGSGNGRLYTITVRCTDDSGNSSRRRVRVSVPHDRR